jgi:hypothetical protein
MAHTTQASTGVESSSSTPVTAGRVAGALALAHVVLMLGALSVEGINSSQHRTAPAKLLEAYAQAPLARTLLAGYVEALAFLVLVPALVILGWLFSRRTTAGRLAAQSFVVFGVAYVASTLASGFPAGAAALYGAHHGADPGSLAMVNDIRNYAFVLQVALTSAMALALGAAALREQRHTRWIGWGGAVLGAVGVLVTPFAPNAVVFVFLVWWIGMAVVLLRDKTTQV